MAKYGIFLTPDLHHIVAMKTTVASPGDADWDNQDNAIIPNGNSPIISMWAVEDGSDIHVATQQKNGRVAYHVFDPGTDDWTIRDEQVVIVGVTNFDNIPVAPAVSLALRSDGDVVLVAAYNNTDPRPKIRVFSRDGTVWTDRGEAGSTSAVDSEGVTVVGPDSSDRISWIFQITSLQTKSLSSTNVLSVVTNVDSSKDSATFVNAPGVIDSANLISIPYIDASDDISVAQFTSAAVPSPIDLRTDISDNNVLGHGATSPPFVVACLALDGTDVHLIYTDAISDDLFHNDDASVSGGGTETEIENNVTAHRVSCKKGTSDLLYFWGSSTGAADYGAISLAAGPNITVPLGTFTLAGQLPTIETGVNVAVPAPKAFNLAGQLPIVGTSVLVTVPVPKAFNLSGILPTIETGVAIIVPAPKAFSLAGQLPIVGTGVDITVPIPKAFTLTGFEPTITVSTPVEIIVPAPKAYNLAGLLPTIETGVTIIVPVPKAFSLAGFNPTIETGVTIIVPVPKAYSLTGFLPSINIGVNVVVPAPKAFSLNGFDPTIETGVTIITPLGTFTLTGFDPVITAGSINIIVPLKTFTRTNFLPAVASGVSVAIPLKTFSLAGLLPIVGTGVDILIPLGTFSLSGLLPSIETGVTIVIPLGTFSLTGQLPIIGTGVKIDIPLGTFSLTGFLPAVGTGVIIDTPLGTFTLTGFIPVIEVGAVNIIIPLKQFNLTSFLPIIHSNRPSVLAADILDLTPPFDDITQIRYLFRNFAVIRDLLEQGVDGQFTTTDGKTVLMRGGLVVDIF